MRFSFAQHEKDVKGEVGGRHWDILKTSSIFNVAKLPKRILISKALHGHLSVNQGVVAFENQMERLRLEVV